MPIHLFLFSFYNSCYCSLKKYQAWNTALNDSQRTGTYSFGVSVALQPLPIVPSFPPALLPSFGLRWFANSPPYPRTRGGILEREASPSRWAGGSFNK